MLRQGEPLPADDLQVGRVAVDQGNPGRDLDMHHGLGVEAVEVHHQTAQGVAVAGHQQAAAGPDARRQHLVPVGQGAALAVGEAFGRRQQRRIEVGVARIEARMARILEGQRRRRLDEEDLAGQLARGRAR